MKSTLLISLISLSFLASPALGWSRWPRPVEIKLERGQVLACILSDEGETVDVNDAGISPFEGSEDPRPKPPSPWQITLNPGSKPVLLQPGQCLAFGRIPSGYTNTVQTSELLEEWPYEFAIRSAERGKYGTRIHSGDFCISRAGGVLKVAQIPHQPEVVTRETCRKLLGIPTGQ